MNKQISQIESEVTAPGNIPVDLYINIQHAYPRGGIVSPCGIFGPKSGLVIKRNFLRNPVIPAHSKMKNKKENNPDPGIFARYAGRYYHLT